MEYVERVIGEKSRDGHLKWGLDKEEMGYWSGVVNVNDVFGVWKGD